MGVQGTGWVLVVVLVPTVRLGRNMAVAIGASGRTPDGPLRAPVIWQCAGSLDEEWRAPGAFSWQRRDPVGSEADGRTGPQVLEEAHGRAFQRTGGTRTTTQLVWACCLASLRSSGWSLPRACTRAISKYPFTYLDAK